MFSISSDEPEDDSSLEFRKCWALGEAYYYLTRDYIYSENDITSAEGIGQFTKFYKSRIEIIQSVCESLELKSDIIYTVLNELRDENYKNRFPEFIKDFDFNRLEYSLIGKLAGKEPRYEDIFRTAKHCQGLHRKISDNRAKNDRFNFTNDLDSLRNFVSMDKRTLIKNVVIEKEWSNVKREYKAFKEKEKEDYRADVKKFPIAAEIKPPETVNIVHKIAGLILGSLEISDILTKSDRFIWVLICYVIFGLSVVLIVGLVIITVYIPYQSILVNYIKLFVPTTGQDLVIILTAGATIATAVIPVFQSIIISWKKLANYVELRLATKRLKHPK